MHSRTDQTHQGGRLYATVTQSHGKAIRCGLHGVLVHMRLVIEKEKEKYLTMVACIF